MVLRILLAFGVVLVNVVDNWEEVENDFEADKKVISQISFFDDGHFQPLKVKDKNLHLHSVTEFENIGTVCFRRPLLALF